MHVLERMIEWYRQHCDGDWEHQHGVHIGTLDNPGWSVDVDVSGTELEGVMLPLEMVERSDTDWCHVGCDGVTFRAAGGVGNLLELLSRFLAWAEEKPLRPPD
jgi:hypothetical protein